MEFTPYLERDTNALLQKYLTHFPVVVVGGPRQAGKSTMLENRLSATHRYISLDAPDVRAIALNDPRGFLDFWAPPVIIDEVQNVPELLDYIKERVDRNRRVRGQWVLTGSQNVLLTEKVTESLAGRAGFLRLLPMTNREAMGQAATPLPWQRTGSEPEPAGTNSSIWAGIVRGGYPELVAQAGSAPWIWQTSFVASYLERDVRSLRQIGDLTQFQTFLRLLALRTGQMLNLTGLASDLGISVNTAKAWLSVLETTYQVLILRPYFENQGKRLVKTPKVYFTDTGTACYLAGIRTAEEARHGPMAGALMENAVILEIYKRLAHQGEDPQMYFWRTLAGREIDLVVRHAGKLVTIEIKAAATALLSDTAGLAKFREEYRKSVGPGYLIYTGEQRLPLRPGITALPFTQL